MARSSELMSRNPSGGSFTDRTPAELVALSGSRPRSKSWMTQSRDRSLLRIRREIAATSTGGRSRARTVSVAAAVLSLALSGCEDVVWIVPSGEYIVSRVDVSGVEPDEALNAMVLTVDRDSRFVSFLLDDGSVITSNVSLRRFSDYCTMSSCENLEAMDIQTRPLTLEGVVFEEPWLEPGIGTIKVKHPPTDIGHYATYTYTCPHRPTLLGEIGRAHV